MLLQYGFMHLIWSYYKKQGARFFGQDSGKKYKLLLSKTGGIEYNWLILNSIFILIVVFNSFLSM